MTHPPCAQRKAYTSSRHQYPAVDSMTCAESEQPAGLVAEMLSIRLEVRCPMLTIRSGGRDCAWTSREGRLLMGVNYESQNRNH